MDGLEDEVTVQLAKYRVYKGESNSHDECTTIDRLMLSSTIFIQFEQFERASIFVREIRNFNLP